MDCRALLQGIFPTQVSNLSLLSPALAGGSLTLVLLRSPSFYYVLVFVYGLYFVEEFSLSTKYVPGFIMRYFM